MILLDIILLFPLVIGMIRGLQKGLLYTLGSLGGYVSGFLIAIFFYDSLALFLNEEWGWGTGFEIKAGAFAVLLLVPVFCFRLLGLLLTKSFNWLSLGPLNYILGALVGVLKYAIIEMGFVYALLYLNKEVQLSLPDSFDESFVYSFFVTLLREVFHIVY